LGSALVISAGPKTYVNRCILSSKVAIWFGLISYPLYLWHWPVLSYARIIEDSTPESIVKVILVLVSIGLAYLTYLFVEKPLRFSANRQASIVGLLIAMSILGSVGLGAAWSEGLSKTRLSEFGSAKILKARVDWEYPSGLRQTSFAGFNLYLNASDTPQVVLFGDSHMEQYGPRVTMYTNQGKAKDVVFFASGGCPPIPNVFDDLHPWCKNFVESFLEYLREHKSIKTIVIGACWNCYFIEGTVSSPSERNKSDFYYKSSEGVDKFRDGRGKDKSLMEFTEFVKGLRNAYEVYVLLDSPRGRGFDPSRMLGGGLSRLVLTFSLNAERDKKSVPVTVERDVRQVRLEDEMRQLFDGSNIIVLGQSQILCQGNACASVDPLGRPIYRDVDHMRPFYIREKMNAMDEAILK
jgi:hypothetical protein